MGAEVIRLVRPVQIYTDKISKEDILDSNPVMVIDFVDSESVFIRLIQDVEFEGRKETIMTILSKGDRCTINLDLNVKQFKQRG